jgi:hypothetical protein
MDGDFNLSELKVAAKKVFGENWQDSEIELCPHVYEGLQTFQNREIAGVAACLHAHAKDMQKLQARLCN